MIKSYWCMKIAEKQYFGTSWENVHFPPPVVFESREIRNQEIAENVKWFSFLEHTLTEDRPCACHQCSRFEWHEGKWPQEPSSHPVTEKCPLSSSWLGTPGSEGTDGHRVLFCVQCFRKQSQFVYLHPRMCGDSSLQPCALTTPASPVPCPLKCPLHLAPCWSHRCPFCGDRFSFICFFSLIFYLLYYVSQTSNLSCLRTIAPSKLSYPLCERTWKSK